MNWIKLNKNKTNLPKYDCDLWIYTENKEVIKSEYNSTVKKLYSCCTVKFTHFMESIKPKPPTNL